MTRDDLRKNDKLVEWLQQGRALGHLHALSELVDHEIGQTGYAMTDPHFVHINLGIQDAVRRTRALLKDPLTVQVKPMAPAPTYGVTPS